MASPVVLFLGGKGVCAKVSIEMSYHGYDAMHYALLSSSFRF